LPDCCGSECDLTGVEEGLRKLQDELSKVKAAVTPLDSVVVEEPISGTFNNGRITLGPRAIAVRFSIVSPDLALRGEYGGGVAPDVEYAGWYSLSRRNGSGGDRRPISYSDQVVPVEPGFTRLSFTCKGATTVSVSVYYRRPAAVQSPSYDGPGYAVSELLYRGPQN
jgi:hypothetical protein